MKKLIVFALITTLCLGLSACAQPASISTGRDLTDSTKTGQHKLSYTEKTLTVELTENVSIGYEWNYSLEKNNLVFVSDEYKVDEKNREATGADSTHIYHFEGVEQGETTLGFQCFYRENLDEAYDELLIVVEIGSDGSVMRASFEDE